MPLELVAHIIPIYEWLFPSYSGTHYWPCGPYLDRGALDYILCASRGVYVTSHAVNPSKPA